MGELKEKEMVEVKMGGSKYLYEFDGEYDCLYGMENGVKVILQFSRDNEKNKQAKEAIKTFFSSL